ncbi:megakaryocyte-associated tyrosine-protein kinase-like [Amphiura filiformis]|uniref:megakaryocyte-associated tyrosine-protein kinase-like n=1 Tax=Amphiura filiformis TaxID=82378 RepID=UPI003B221169
MVYADDTQVYAMYDPSASTQAIASIEACVSDIRAWAISNKVKINDAKTDILHISSRCRSKATAPSVQVGTADIKPVEGVFIDNQLTMSNHVSDVCRTALYALRSISQLRKYLDKTTTERLVHAFISSRLDSCNGLLYGLPDADIAKLQRVQNSAARLVAPPLPTRWLAPESLKDQTFNVESDVWSFGVLLYELTSNGKIPYPSIPNEEIREAIKQGNAKLQPDASTPKGMQNVEITKFATAPDEQGKI